MQPQTLPGVRLSRVFNASRERVFAAWTDPEQLKRWWGAGSAYRAEAVQVELKVGGAFNVSMRHITKDIVNGTVGTITALEPGRKVVYTWAWQQKPEAGTTTVTVEFRDHPKGCELVLVHDGFTDAKMAGEHNKGWNACLAMLRQRIFPDCHALIRAPSLQFHQHQWMVVSACEGFDDASARREAGQANSPAWILAHLVNARQAMLRLLGADITPQWSDLVGYGKPHPEAATLPAWDELRGAWATTEPLLIETFSGLDEAALTKPTPAPIPVEPNTNANLIAFLATHEAYHIGQLAFARRALGMPHAPIMP
jgi:uncharacterized protein YndB with AHSA1/START domain/uncharacterized damage-inducible protein DinB